MTHLCHSLRIWAIALTLGLCSATGAMAQAPGMEAFQHGEPPLAGIGGPLALTDHHGRPYNLQTLGSQPALLFFGFTRCATACPAALTQAREFLAQYKARRAPPVLFVTLDPLSDTPQALGQFLSAVDPRITGLTGTPSQIQQVAQRYGVATQGSDTTLEHSARWYTVDAQATVLRVYNSKERGADMAADLTRWQQRLSAPAVSLKK